MTASREKILKSIHNGVDPFKNVSEKDVEEYSDLQGWNSHHEFYDEAIEQLDPKVIVEAGVWKGMSSIHIAKKLKADKKDAVVICIDTWLGCHILWQIKQWKESMHVSEFGRPETWKVFYANVVKEGLQDYIVPIHMDTKSGLRLLRDKKIFTQLFLHDASHQSPDVLHELELSQNIVQPGGWIIVDDYLRNNAKRNTAMDFSGVISDVDSFVNRYHLTVEIKEPKAKIIL